MALQMSLSGPPAIILQPVSPQVPDPYLRPLRNKLLTTFASHEVITATDDVSLGLNASIMPSFAAVVTTFQMHGSKEIVRRMIEQIDTSDEPRLADLQTKLLAVPEWSTDNSDVA